MRGTVHCGADADPALETVTPVDATSIEQIETKIAFLERANAELSDVVFRQHRDIEALREQVAALATRIAAREADVPAPSPQDERPPHY